MLPTNFQVFIGKLVFAIMLETLVKIIPTFNEYWDDDEVYKETDGSFSPHGLMGSFLDFYQNNYEHLSFRQLSYLCMEFEALVSADPADKNPTANAICTMFLELLVDTKAGDKIEPFLGRSCRKFWDCYKF